MRTDVRDALIFGIFGSLLVFLGGQSGGGEMNPCNKNAYLGDKPKYFGPDCTSGVPCASDTYWFVRDQNDMCGPGTAYEVCQTMKDPLGPYTYTVYRGGSCLSGRCTPVNAIEVNQVVYDLWLFSALYPCGGWQ